MIASWADLFTVLIGHDGSARRSGVDTETDALFFSRIAAAKLDSYNGRSRRGSYKITT